MSTLISDRNGLHSDTNLGKVPTAMSASSVSEMKRRSGGVTVISISSSKSAGSAPKEDDSRLTTPPPPLPSSSSSSSSSSAAASKNHRPALTGSMCMVCHDVAPSDTVFRRHYGVVCCEACKCFFRRTVQMNRDYKCRYGSSCSIGRNAENLKQVCQACRFNQCITAGMKLDCELVYLYLI